MRESYTGGRGQSGEIFLRRAMILLADSHDVSLVKNIIVIWECACVPVKRVYVGMTQCSLGLVTAVVISLRYEKMASLILFPANCEIPFLSDDGAGNSLKAESMCTTKTVVADRP